eukprot:365035-Chlamydomonas_euryale.AAC.6
MPGAHTAHRHACARQSQLAMLAKPIVRADAVCMGERQQGPEPRQQRRASRQPTRAPRQQTIAPRQQRRAPRQQRRAYTQAAAKKTEQTRWLMSTSAACSTSHRCDEDDQLDGSEAYLQPLAAHPRIAARAAAVQWAFQRAIPWSCRERRG